MSAKKVEPGKTIGILGGGQLGRMMALSAREMGYGVAVLDPTPNSPCGQVADLQIEADYDDLTAAKKLADACDILTYEFENIDAEAASWLEDHLYMPQGSQALTITQDRIKEKTALVYHGFPLVPYEEIYTQKDLKIEVQKIGLPAVLKTTRGGYDGKGQYIIKTKDDIPKAWDSMRGSDPFVLEKWIDFDKEISVIVTRSITEEVSVFPVVENIHINNILHQSIVPARISAEIEEKATQLALKLAESFNLVGTLAVELFLTKEGDIYINELAPRPHNSGHYTINACVTSQFEQHIRAICGWPLGSTELLKPVVMVNLLGEHMADLFESVTKIKGAHLHLYGKAEARDGRKMGHVTILAETVDEALQAANDSPIWKR